MIKKKQDRKTKISKRKNNSLNNHDIKSLAVRFGPSGTKILNRSLHHFVCGYVEVSGDRSLGPSVCN